MLTPSHLVLANIVGNDLQKKQMPIDHKSLKRGSTRPDFSPKLFTIPHYFDMSWDYLKEEIRLLIFSGYKKTEEFSYRLGIIIHYLTDYFCYAHNDKVLRNEFSLHIRYEYSLDRLFRAHYKNLLGSRMIITNQVNIKVLKSFFEYIERMHNAYCKKSSTFENDFFYAVSFCLVFSNLLAYQLK